MLNRQQSQFRRGFGAQAAQLLLGRDPRRFFKAGLCVGVFAVRPEKLAECKLDPGHSYHHMGTLGIRKSLAENAFSLCGAPQRNQRTGSSQEGREREPGIRSGPRKFQGRIEEHQCILWMSELGESLAESGPKPDDVRSVAVEFGGSVRRGDHARAAVDLALIEGDRA